MANMMSLNISDEVIKAAVREEVSAGIVKALGNPEIDIVNIGLHFFHKDVRLYAASCSEV